MLRRSTIITLLLLAALIGLAFYLSSQKEKGEAALETETPTAEKYLFEAGGGMVSSIKITDQAGKIVWIRRDASQAWRYVQPVSMEADASAAEAAASQAMSLRVLNTVDLPLSVTGLDQPTFTIIIGFDSGKQAEIKIGAVTPIGSGYYVLQENSEVAVVSKVELDSLLRVFQNLPASPTPAVTPTAESTAMPEASATP